MGNSLFDATICGYIVGLIMSLVAFVSKKDWLSKAAILVMGVGFFLHTTFLVLQGVAKAQFPLTDLREELAFFAWAVSLCFFLSYLRYRIKALGLFLLPLVAVLMLGTVFIKSSPVPKVLASYWVFLHTTFLMLAYGMLFVTFVAGFLYLLQERELKNKKPRTFFHRLPSLVLLDDLFYRFLVAGFCFMTLGLLAGVVWAEKDLVSGWQRDPRVVSALVTWGIYLVLIYFRVTAGWRGKRAALLSMAGFVSALFAFLGANYFGGLHAF
ncbi:MAG: cytochrome c biogenesis protein CcsA [Acidobacteriota bacterium]